MSTPASDDEARVAEATAVVNKIGPRLNGHGTTVLISALSALIGTVIYRHSEATGVNPRKLLDVVCRHALATAAGMAQSESAAVRH